MKKSILMGLGVCALALGGVAALVGQKGAVMANAAGEINIFVDVSSCSKWTEASAETTLWVWGEGNTGSWVVGSNLGGGLYKCSAPAGTTGFQIVRRGNGSERWTESPNQTVGAATNLYKLSGEYGKGDISKKYLYEIPANTTYYIDLDYYTNWFADGAVTQLDAFAANLHQVVTATRIPNTNMLQATFDTVTYADALIVIRGTGAFDGSSFANPPVWAQTLDIDYVNDGTSNVGANGIIVSGYDDNGKKQIAGFENATDSFFAKCYSISFLNRSLCKDEGGLMPAASTEWTNASSEYTAYYNLLTDKNYFKDVSSSGEELINQAMARYDAVVSKNPSYANFISRSTSGANVVSSLVKDENNPTPIIGAIAIGALISVGGLFLLRKRKAE